MQFLFESVDVHGVVRDGMSARCGMVCRDVVERFDVNYGASVECCNFRHGAIEMPQNVRCGIWHCVEYSVLVCGMLHIMQDV